MIKLYTAVIRPQLEYAEVWDPHLQKNVELLENVQKQALRMCSRQWDLTYHALFEQFHLPNLVNRRVHLKLCTLFKIVHGLLYFPSHVVTPDVHSSRHHAYSLPLLHCPYAHTTAFQSSFVPSSISVWNHLPSEALHATSVRTFKLFTVPLFM